MMLIPLESPYSPIWQANRSCSACPLHLTCKGPVPGYGPISTDIMLIGEAPGKREDEDAIPFKNEVGAGAELTLRLRNNGIERKDCYITNVVKCRPSSSNRNPTKDEIDTCAPTWLIQEIVMVRPKIVVTMGLFATRYITGLEDSMDHLHGIPLKNVPVYRRFECSVCAGLKTVQVVEPVLEDVYDENGSVVDSFEVEAGVLENCGACDGEGEQGERIYTIPIVLPIYHPAAGLHNTNLMKQIQKDFAVLGGLAARRSPEEYQLIDNYPDPAYRELEEISEVYDYIWGNEVFPVPEIAMDTETVKDKLWSIQLSRAEGEAVFIRKGLWEAYTADQLENNLPVFPNDQTVYVHNYLYDARILSWDQDSRLGPAIFIDTMVVAYLVGMPLGLKTLARDIAGVLMFSFDDMIRATRKAAVVDWIERGIEAGSDRKFCENCSGSGRILSEKQHKGYLEGKEGAKPRTKKCQVCEGAGALEEGYPDMPPIEFMSWDNKEGRLLIQTRTPNNIMKKFRNIIKDADDGESDPEDRLKQIEDIELVSIVDRIGMLPETSIDDVAEEVSIPYACRDADTTLRVAHSIMPLLYETGTASVLYLQDLPILPIVLRMMRNGMLLDLERFKEMSVELMHMLGFSSVAASQKAGEIIYGGGLYPGDAPEHRFNPNSTHQVAQVLYELSTWPSATKEQRAMLKPGTNKLQPTKFTDTGLPSTADKELQKIKSVFPHAKGLITDITDYREYLKLKSTYVEPLPLKVDKGNRLHTTFLTVNTETGRLASRDPNVMNIPVRSEMGKRIRYGFICRCGFSFLAEDYSQIEMRVIMHISGCVRGIQLFRDGRDLHTETAADIFGVSLEEAAKDQYRYPVKRLGFGVVYGITEYGLADLMIQEGVEGWDQQRCKQFIKEYFKLFPEIEAFQKHTKAFVREMGYVEDMWGRRRYIPEVTSAVPKVIASGERMAINMPVQSGAQGIIKRAMVVVSEEIEKHQEWEGRIFDTIQNHDELIWEVDDEIIEEVAPIIQERMESVVSLSVPVTCDIEMGKDWGSLKKWKQEVVLV